MASSQEPPAPPADDDSTVEQARPDTPLTVEHAADEPIHPAEAAAPPREVPPPPAEPVVPAGATGVVSAGTDPAAAPAKKRRLSGFSFGRTGRFFVRHIAWFLFGLALIAAGVFAALWLDLRTEADERAELEQQTERFVLALTNFSADTIDQDVAEIKGFAVGDFAEEADVFFGKEAIDAIKTADARSEGEIESIYVQSLEGDTASVFAVVSETVINSDLAEPRTDVLRMNVDLVESESGWRVTNVDVLQSPGSTVVGA